MNLVRVGISFAIVGLLASAPVALGKDADPYVYFEGPLPVLEDARQFVLEGKKTAKGCRWEYPEMHLSSVEYSRIQRDLAIAQTLCLKIVEEGTATWDESLISDSSSSLEIGSSSAQADGLAVAASSSGKAKVWWQDAIGLLVNSDATIISWSWSGSCVTSGSTQGEWTWRSGTGWRLRDTGGSQNLNCTRYLGETDSYFDNPVFCPDYVTTYYYYVRAYGYPGGSMGMSWSSDTYNECLPLYEKHQIIR